MMSKRAYERRLDGMLEDIFGAADRAGLGLSALSKATGLCLRTVQRLNRYDTRLPRLKTVMLLATALDLSVEMVGQGSADDGDEPDPQPIPKPKVYRPAAGRKRRA